MLLMIRSTRNSERNMDFQVLPQATDLECLEIDLRMCIFTKHSKRFGRERSAVLGIKNYLIGLNMGTRVKNCGRTNHTLEVFNALDIKATYLYLVTELSVFKSFIFLLVLYSSQVAVRAMISFIPHSLE